MVSTNERIRVLVVDDSALMRKLLSDILQSDPAIEVVGIARDGADAIEKTAELRPQVVTLDVEMPGISGLEALPLIQAAHPTAVIMVSSLTQEGADTTLAALEGGAIDFFPKPERHQLAQMRESGDILIAKIRAAAGSKPRRVRTGSATATGSSSFSATGTGSFHSRPAPAPGESGTHPNRPGSAAHHEADLTIPNLRPVQCIAIGISTGGPQALTQTLPHVTTPTPPILIVQHMPAQFTAVFAARLNGACSLKVKEAEEGDRVLPNQVLIAPGGRHMAITGLQPNVRITISDSPPVSGHRPSVDFLFHSVARVYQREAAGLIMTGMGRDGVLGCQAIQAVGGLTFGQDEASSAVYGMNKAAFLEGAASDQFSLEQLARLIKRLSPA